MPVMTILGCRIFEDEVVHLIEKGPELEEVIVVEKENNEGIIRKLKEIDYPHKVLPLENIPKISERKEAGGEAAGGEKTGEKKAGGEETEPATEKEGQGFTLIVDLLEFALDGAPEQLKEVVYETVGKLREYSDGVLLFYGLCGNVLGNIEEDFDALGFPVFILRDEEGAIVDDCIGAVLGGRESFLSELDVGCGTYFLTPVGAVYWKEMLVASKVTPDPENVEMTKMVFDYSGYKNIGKIDTGLRYEKEFEAKAREFAELYNFEVLEVKGSPKLLESCYGKAREALLNRKTDKE